MFLSSTEGAQAVETVQPASSYFYPLTVRGVRAETRDSMVLTFDVPEELEEKFRFVQGQFVTLRAIIDGHDVRRSYSICSAVQDRVLRVGIKRAPGGLFSNWIAENVKAGSQVEVMPPEGRFHVALSAGHSKSYVAFAAGSGITPILSLIKTTLLSEPHSEFTLFYGNRASSTIMFREELAELKDVFLDRFVLVHVMSREHQDLELLNGRITGGKAEQLLRHFCRFEEIDHIFLCGPDGMAEDIFGRLQALGVPEARIKIERFSATPSGPQRVSPTHAEKQCQLTIVVDGVRHVLNLQRNGETVLDAALQRGLDLRHSCKSGVCATCRAKVVEGQVDMDANYALEDYEIARGFVLTCQSYPVSDRVTVDFDQDS
ncbi:MAG: phenylacetate-CoA oxygenase/reductase subunit PaaK [Acidobacteriaceae bacterium]|nr:phenylacetate-CoA oxygenase/reductase subunit PaaK [Acidobacteriaceae bacterium]